MPVVQRIAAVRDRETRLGVLLHQEDAGAGVLDARERAEQLAAEQGGARAKARPASGSRAPTSWRGRPPPSAARRRSSCAPAGCAARRARKQRQHALEVLGLAGPRAPRVHAEHEVRRERSSFGPRSAIAPGGIAAGSRAQLLFRVRNPKAGPGSGYGSLSVS
jgi:hypothetical protein